MKPLKQPSVILHQQCLTLNINKCGTQIGTSYPTRFMAPLKPEYEPSRVILLWSTIHSTAFFVVYTPSAFLTRTESFLVWRWLDSLHLLTMQFILSLPTHKLKANPPCASGWRFWGFCQWTKPFKWKKSYGCHQTFLRIITSCERDNSARDSVQKRTKQEPLPSAKPLCCQSKRMPYYILRELAWRFQW